jgi:hypothetical protein
VTSYEPYDDLPYDDGARPPRRFRGLIITGLVALVAGAAVAGFLVREQSQDGGTPAEPALLSETQLRAAPQPDAEIVASLPAETAIDLHGRTEDGAWLVIAEQGQASPRGWVPLLAIRNAGDIEAVPLVAAPPRSAGTQSPLAVASPVTTRAAVSMTPTPTATFTLTTTPAAAIASGTADVRVQEVTSRSNRLALIVANVGTAVAPPEFDLALDGGPPRRVMLEAELPPEQSSELVLGDVYVQRRASVTVTITPAGAGATAKSSSATAVVDPDQPNDLELLPPASHPDDGHLVVTLRNNSAIPLVGGAIISVRELPPSNQLLARSEAPFNLAPGATTEVQFTDVIVDLAQLHVSVETSAVTDAEIGNNSYPR